MCFSFRTTYVCQESNLKDIEDVHYLRLYMKWKIFCINNEVEGTQNQVLDIFFLLKNFLLLLFRPGMHYIIFILVFNGNSYYRFGRIEYLHNQGMVQQKPFIW